MKSFTRVPAILAALALLLAGVLTGVTQADAAGTRTVTFRADHVDGPVPGPITVAAGVNAINLPDDYLMRDDGGSAFYGWSPDPLADPEVDPSNIFTPGDAFRLPDGEDNVVLYAKWSPTPRYDVNYYSHDGLFADGSVIEYGTTTPPSAPAREGHTFVGWSATAQTGETTNPLFDLTTLITAPTNLYAQWARNMITVTFQSHGGSAVEDQTVPYESKLERPTDPTFEGHTLRGWTVNEDGSDPWDFNDPVRDPMTLHAQWKLNEYTVKFDARGGAPNYEMRVSHGSTVNAPADPQLAGHAFDGWTTDEAGEHPWDFDAPVKENMTLYAQWDLNEYTVTFDSRGGSPVTAEKVSHGAVVPEPDDPTFEGYVFAGWSTDEAGEHPWEFSTTVTEDVTLYAQWTVARYDVTFLSHGGTEVPTETVDHGETVTQPVDPTRDGFVFAGWSVTEQTGLAPQPLFGFDTPITAETTLHAQWLQEFEVTFDSDGGTPVAAQTVPYSRLVEEPQVTREGYTLDGWYLTPTPASTRIAADGKWDFATDQVTGPMTLQARWTPVPVPATFTVAFDTRGGSTIEPVTVEEGKPVVKPADPTRSGFTFAGWTTDAAGTASYDFGAPVTADLTLFAQWTAIPDPTPPSPEPTPPAPEPTPPAPEPTPTPSSPARPTPAPASPKGTSSAVPKTGLDAGFGAASLAFLLAGAGMLVVNGLRGRRSH